MQQTVVLPEQGTQKSVQRTLGNFYPPFFSVNTYFENTREMKTTHLI